MLRFGEFKTKAGRLSPYFFNAGLFDDGAKLGELARLLRPRRARLGNRVRRDLRTGLQGDHAGRGHRRGACRARSQCAVLLQSQGGQGPRRGRQHRRRTPSQGRALIIDDVITEGAAKREAIELIRAAGATPAGILIALDRQERGQGALSATQEVSRDYGLPVTAIATLADILATLEGRPGERAHVERILEYKRQYGVA